MMTTCTDCGLTYDDARRMTFCPHEPLMSDEDLAQKDAAIALLGRRIRFNHQRETGPDMRVRSVGWNGMVTVDALPGEFAPHLFVVVEP
jgi:hypothetical protein